MGAAQRAQRPERPRKVHSGHIVVGELACVALLSAAVSGSPLAWVLALPLAAVLGFLAAGRYQGRWLYQWLGTAIGYATRPRYLPAAHPYTLLNLIDPLAEPAVAAQPEAPPGQLAEPGGPRVAFVDGAGALAVLELGGNATAVSDTVLRLPALDDLLPPARDITAQLLIVTRPASGAGPIGEAYRQLTEGHIAGYRRILLAVRAAPTPDTDPGEALGAALRRVRRRLTDERIAHRGLDPAECLAAIAEAAGLDGAGADPGRPGGAGTEAAGPDPAAGGTSYREDWSRLRLGGLHQTTLRVCRPGAVAGPAAGQLVARLMALPGALVVVSLAAADSRVALAVRVAAPRPESCAGAALALRRIASSAGLSALPLAGRQLAGLAATLPLALPRDADPGRPAGYRTELAPPGLLAGHNRQGRPVSVRLFAARPTRAVLLGGLALAQVFILRALAIDARVVVHSTRPRAWIPFLDAAGLPPELLRLVPPDTGVEPAPRGTTGRPVLLVYDNVEPTGRLTSWSSALVLRETLTTGEAAALSRADLVIAQRLSEQAAALAGAALGLGAGTDWLTRINSDLIGLFSPPTVRWAALGATDLERWLVRSTGRVAVG